MAKSKFAVKKYFMIAALAMAFVVCCVTLSTPIASIAYAAEATYQGKYYTDYQSLEEAKKAAEELTRELAQEGDVLLKNSNEALPLSGREWVSVFGVTSDNLIGASDSSGAFSGSSTGSDSTVAAALESAGYKVNPTLKAFYSDNTNSHGDEVTSFNGQVKESFDLYNDVAFVVFSREGGEGSDASRVTSEAVAENDTHKALYTDENGVSYKHSLMLTDSEIALLELVKSQFKKVVVLTNTSNPMEINDLKLDDEIDAIIHIGRPGVGGLDGLADIVSGKVSPSGGLVDEWAVDFTADPTWYNFGNNNQTANYNGAAGSTAYKHADGTKTGTTGYSTAYEGSEGYYGVDYEEGIYLGYKYYETVYTEIALGHLTYTNGTLATAEGTQTETSVKQAAQWWSDNVAYQYGYGLSYTTFSFNAGKLYTDKALKTELGATIDASLFNSSKNSPAKVSKLYLPVTVKNTGSVAGKKTVQVYVTAPYLGEGAVEKSAVVLVGFAKTSTLKPGASQTVVVEFNVQDMASWDSTAANGDNTNGHYIMDVGEYVVRVMESSHYDFATDTTDTTDAYDEVRFTLTETVHQKLDDFSGNQLKNLFTTGDNDVSKGDDVKVGDLNYGNVRTADMMADGTSGMTVLSRASLVDTFPKAPTTGDLTFKDSYLANWAFWDNYTVDNKAVDGSGNPTTGTKTYYDRMTPGETTYDAQTNYVNDVATDPWYKTKADIPSNWTQATGVYDANHKVKNNRTELVFPMYVSVASESTIKYKDMYGVAYDDAKWDLFLNQLTYDELCTVVEFGGYSTVDIASVGKEKSEDSDGPNNWDSSHCWCSEDIIASTFNIELAEKQGKIMGNIGLLKDPTSTQTGWYGPGADIHRSPFSGRNNEYYSQDSLHGGYIAAAVIKGVQSKGVICYVKHCFMNDQETNRGNLFTWATEQSMRETYIRTFQMALQEGGSKGGMVAYGRLGGLSNTNNYNLSTELYQNQWGTHACFVTDGYIGWKIRTDPDIMVRSGNVFELYTTPFVEYLSGEWDAEKGTVIVGEGDNATESYTQWYAVRMCAKSVLYNIASTVGQRNGYSELSLTGGSIGNAMQSVKFEGSVSIAAAIDSDSTVTMSIASGKLPAGLQLNELTGAISGTPTEVGKFDFAVQYIIDGFIAKTVSYSVNVEAALSLDKDGDATDQMKVGEEFMTRIVSTEFTADKYDSLKYSLLNGNLPDGITVGEDGVISGTPTQAGTYNVTVRLTAEKSGSSGGKGGSKGGSKGGQSKETTNVDLTLQLVVKGDGQAPAWTENVPYIGENGNWFVNGTDLGVKAKAEDGVTPEIKIDATTKHWIVNGVDTGIIAEGANGQDGKSGCNSTIGVSAAVAGLIVVAAAAFVVLRRKEKTTK